MKDIEERLKELPQIAQDLGLDADLQLQYRIRNAAREKAQRKKKWLKRLVPSMAGACVAVLALCVAIPKFGVPKEDEIAPVAAQAAGENTAAPNGRMKSMLDVDPGSMNISVSEIPSYKSIWAQGSSGNFPMICVEGRYYRMLTTPSNVSGSLMGNELGQVDTFTDEPSLAGTQGIVSNVVSAGETVYAVDGMAGAMAAASVNGKVRVFQRVSFGDSALVGGESLSDTLKANRVISLRLSDVGTVSDSDTAKNLMNTLMGSASYQRAGSSETGQSLLIYLSNGLTMQLAVRDDKVMGCGTWSCPDFFEQFESAVHPQ